MAMHGDAWPATVLDVKPQPPPAADIRPSVPPDRAGETVLRSAAREQRTREVWRQLALPLGVFVIGQGLAATWMRLYAGRAGTSYVEFVSRWDGAYYLDIARHGYTRAILQDGAFVDQNWAFYPLYPLTVGALSRATGFEAAVVAPAVSLVCGAAALVLLHRLVLRHVGDHAATTSTLLVGTAVAAPVLQMAYAEGLALLLLVLALESVASGRHARVVVLAPLLALSRPLALPFAVVVAFDVLRGWRRSTDGHPLGLLRVAWCVGMVALWPAIGALVTGVPDVYLRTMAMWEVPGVGRSWFTQCADRPIGWLLILAALTLPAWVAFRFLPPRVPLAWRVWMVAYPAYLLFGVFPSSSTVRYLLLALPFALALGRRGVPTWLPWVLAALGLVAQLWWVQAFVASSEDIFP
jgi:hypothetical protein